MDNSFSMLVCVFTIYTTKELIVDVLLIISHSSVENIKDSKNLFKFNPSKFFSALLKSYEEQ